MASLEDKSQVRAVTTSKYSWPHLEIGCHLGRGLVCSPIYRGRIEDQSYQVKHLAHPLAKLEL